MNRRLLITTALISMGTALAFTLSDHGRKAFIRPAAKIADFEAEISTTTNVVADKDAANGQAVLLKPGGQQLTFSKTLPRSTYSVWCIGRSDQNPSKYREPMYVELTVTGPHGTQQWRQRINYEHRRFQDVAHLYVDVNVPGEYTFALRLGKGSTFNLLVDRLELRDVLEGTWKKGFKTESVLFTSPAPVKRAMPPFTAEELAAMAHDLYGSLPPRNAIYAGGGMDKEGYYQEFSLGKFKMAEPNAGRWMWRIKEPIGKPWAFSGPTLPTRDDLDMILDEKPENEAPGMVGAIPESKSFGRAPANWQDINWGTVKLGPEGSYTAADYAAMAKAPGRWPDDGGGYFIPKAFTGSKDNEYFNWMAVGFKQRLTEYRSTITSLADDYYTKGDVQAGQKAAMMLAFWSDHFPSIDYTVQSTMQVTWGTYPFNDFSGNNAGEYGKLGYSGWAGDRNLPVMLAYDKLFPLIKDNADLAAAVGQIIPWVKTPADVVELVDVKLVQHFYDACDRGEIRFSVRCDPLVGMVQGNNEAGRAMLHAIAFESDFQHLSVRDELVSRRSRDTTSYIGSMFYAKGPSMIAGTSVIDISTFGKRFELPQFDLVKQQKDRFRQVAQWLIEPYAAGVHLNGVGDVSGPEGYPCMTLPGDNQDARRVLLGAWEETQDPRFAYMYSRVYRGKATPAIEQAAASLPRDPRVGQPSRALSGFGVTVLEANRLADDFTHRSAVVMRTGYGAGHAHQDQLNLEIFAKGLVMVPEFGGRGGYGEPQTGAVVSHALVSVDGRVSPTGQTRFVADLPGCQVTQGVGGQVQRLIALVEAGPQDSYVADFVRASGGKNRQYWFHGQQSDAVDPSVVKAASEGEDDPLTMMLGEIADENKADKRWKYNQHVFSHSPKGSPILQAAWPLQKNMEQRMWNRLRLHSLPDGKRIESRYQADSPRLFTRLTLLDSAHRKLDTIVAVSRQVGYRISCLGASEVRPPDEQSVFAGIIDYFAGKPFIEAIAAIELPEAAGKPRGIQVTMTDKRTDHFHQSDDPAATTTSPKLTATGRFGWASQDSKGVRALGIVDGTAVMSRDLSLKPERATYQTTITAVDFANRRITLADSIPAHLLTDSYWRLGAEHELFRIRHAQTTAAGTVLTLDKSFETYQAPLQLLHDGNEIVGTTEPEARHKTGWLTNETKTGGWPITGSAIGRYRWMGTSFRGGSKMGFPLTWESIPDTDGDGRRTLTFGTNDDWTEPMTIEIIQVVERLRAFLFKPLKNPAGYKGTRSYAGSQITNEQGDWLGVTVIPGKTASFVVDASLTTETDFPDANGDGQRDFHVYFFGPGAPAELTTYAGIERQANGTWAYHANVPTTITPPAGKSLQISTDSGATWQPITDNALDASRATLRFAP